MVRRSGSFGCIGLRRLRALRGQTDSGQSYARSEQGSALVETAVAFVILLPMVLGILQCSLALYAYNFVSDAAEEATRFAMVRGSTCTGFATACPAVPADVQNFIRSLNYPGIVASSLTATTTWPSTDPSCASPCKAPGHPVSVTVSYPFLLSIPFVPAQTLNLTSSSQMVISQ